MTWLTCEWHVVIDTCLVMYLHVIKIYGLRSVLCLMQMLHAMKNFKFYIFIVSLHTLSFNGIKSLLSHELHAKMLIFASVVNMDYV